MKEKEYVDIDEFLGGGVHYRTRVTEVEIEQDVNTIDVARVTIIDPEYRIIRLKNWEYIWYISIGYAGLPDEHWVHLVGVPQVELPRYEEVGEPRITLSILSVVVRMTKHQFITGEAVGDVYTIDEHGNRVLEYSVDISEFKSAPDPIQTAVRLIARNHGLTPEFGQIRAGDALHYYDILNFGQAARVYFDTEFPRQAVYNDFEYLNLIVNLLNDWEINKRRKEKEEEAARRAVPGIPTAPSSPVMQMEPVELGNDLYRWGVIGTKLVLAKWRRDVPGFGVIPVFLYRKGNCALLEFKPRFSNVESESNKLAAVIDAVTGKTVVVGEPEPIKRVIPPKFDIPKAEAKKQIGLLAQQEKRPDHFFLMPVGPDQYAAELDVSRVAEQSKLNIEGEAKLIGYPELRAGMLVGFGGLGVGTTEASETEPAEQRLFSFDRVYSVRRVRHHLDCTTGVYRTHPFVVSSDQVGSIDDIVDQFANLDTLTIKDEKGFWQDPLGALLRFFGFGR